jgi:hypothetical protein
MVNKYNPKYIRMSIKWTDLLLSLGACGGDLTVDILDPTAGHQIEKIMTARVKVERYQLGYSDMEFFSDVTYDEYKSYLKPTIDTMIRSYHKGMLLENEDVNWIRNWRVKDKGE